MILGPFSLDRMERAVERIRDRLLRATAILDQAGVPYAVVGGNAVGLWVSRADEAAVRNTRDVDILLRRADFDRAKLVMEEAGFVYRHVKSVDLFLDGPDAKARDAVHVIFAGEKVRIEEQFVNPDVDESESTGEYRVLKLEPLVRIKLTAFRDKDRMHVRDLLDVGLVDASWVGRLPPQLAERLQTLIDTPEG